MKRVDESLLYCNENCDKMETITVRRKDLETEHRQLLSRIQYLRQLLGYAPLNTGHQQRVAERR
jgi:hypothetical protein